MIIYPFRLEYKAPPMLALFPVQVMFDKIKFYIESAYITPPSYSTCWLIN